MAIAGGLPDFLYVCIYICVVVADLRRHSREIRERGWDNSLFKLETSGSFKNPFDTAIKRTTDTQRQRRRSLEMIKRGPQLPPPPERVDEVLHRLAAYVMLHKVDLDDVKKAQDFKRCGWIHTTEVREALLLYGIPIERSEGIAVGRYLSSLNNEGVVQLDDLHQAVGQYVAH